MTARGVAPVPGDPAEPYPGAPDDEAPPPIPLRERLGRTRRSAGRAIGRTLRVAVPLAVLAVASYGAGIVAAGLADEYGFHPERDRQAWLVAAPRFADAGQCTTCHGAAVEAVASAQHASIECQACHGPLAAHVTDPYTARVTRPIITRELPGPTQEPRFVPREPAAETAEGQVRTCLTCHERTLGRAAVFPMVDAAKHFAGPPCTTCHRPHAPEPLRPSPVLHPLQGLPACTTCHRPDGIRPMPEQHPTWSGPCLDCHRTTDATAFLRREEG